MEDEQIIELYWERNELAITKTADKYGSFLMYLAMNILSVHEDAEECVNDTYEKAWNSIPPERPRYFRAWLGKITRNTALNVWHRNHAEKRYNGLDVVFDELADCIPDARNVEQHIEAAELGAMISKWLETLKPEERALFIRRYWNGESLEQLAGEFRMRPNQLAQRMYRLRNQLKKTLEKEGVVL